MRKLAPDTKHATGATNPPTQPTDTTAPTHLDSRPHFTEDLNKVSEVSERPARKAHHRGYAEISPHFVASVGSAGWPRGGGV